MRGAPAHAPLRRAIEHWIQDSLELGPPHIRALARLKGVVDAAERPRQRVLRICWTRSSRHQQRRAETRSARSPVTCSKRATGDDHARFNLAEEEPLKSSARLVHFTKSDEDSHDALRLPPEGSRRRETPCA